MTPALPERGSLYKGNLYLLHRPLPSPLCVPPVWDTPPDSLSRIPPGLSTRYVARRMSSCCAMSSMIAATHCSAPSFQRARCAYFSPGWRRQRPCKPARKTTMCHPKPVPSCINVASISCLLESVSLRNHAGMARHLMVLHGCS